MSRRLVALLLMQCAAVAGVFVLVAPAQAQTVQQAWWNLANQGAGQPPDPPDVGSNDLLVQFGDSTGVYAGVSSQPGTGASAIAAVRFEVPDGETPQTLTLRLGSQPSAMNVVICPVEGAFKPELNGPYADVPSFDCSHQIVGKLDSSRNVLEFDNVADVASTSELSVVVLPGQTDRVVIKQVQPSDLTFTSNGSSFVQPVAPPSVSSAAPAPAAPNQAPVAVPSAAVPSIPAQCCPQPVTSPQVAVPQQPVPRALAELDPNGPRVKYLAMAELAIILAAIALYATPLRNRLLPVTQSAAERGVGRFRAARSGAPPRL